MIKRNKESNQEYKMSMPSKIHAIRLVKVQPEERATTPELNLACDIKLMNDKTLQTTRWGSDQLIALKKQGNAIRGKGLIGEPFGERHIFSTVVKDVNQMGLVTYLENGGVVLLKSRKTPKSASERGVIVASGRGWL